MSPFLFWMSERVNFCLPEAASVHWADCLVINTLNVRHVAGLFPSSISSGIWSNSTNIWIAAFFQGHRLFCFLFMDACVWGWLSPPGVLNIMRKMFFTVVDIWRSSGPAFWQTRQISKSGQIAELWRSSKMDIPQPAWATRPSVVLPTYVSNSAYCSLRPWPLVLSPCLWANSDIVLSTNAFI